MKNKKKIILTAVGAFLLFGGTIASAIGAIIYSENEANRLTELQKDLVVNLKSKKGEYDSNSLILEKYSQNDLNYFKEKYDVKVRQNPQHTFATLTIPAGSNVLDIVGAEENLRYADKIHIDYHANYYEEEPEEITLYYPNYSSSEPDYHEQKYLNYINIGDTWKTTFGKKESGEKIKVAVIDTGIDYDHEEFLDDESNTIVSPLSYNASEDQTVKQYGYDVIDDETGHGTGVAGVIAAQINNRGIMGIAPDIELIVIKVEAKKDGSFKRVSDVAYGIYYAIEKGANVINLSLGTGDPVALVDACTLAYDSDILVVASAGNTGKKEEHIYPAAYENVIGVGATAKDSYERAEYSSYGPVANMYAPGTTYTTVMGGGYRSVDGTSFAAPIVAAAGALYISQVEYPNSSLMLEDFYASCRDIGPIGYDDVYAYGLLDVNALVLEEKGYVTFDPTTYGLDMAKVRFVYNHALVKMPEEPYNDNLIFNGWYFEKAYKTVFKEEEYYTRTFAEECTLYAQWVNEDDVDAKSFSYNVKGDGTIEITGYRGHHQLLNIPETINGKAVTSIGEKAFYRNLRIKVVNFPESLQSIGEKAFFGCSLIKAINFKGENLEEIADGAFSECSALSYASFPDSLYSIGKTAFMGCVALGEVKFNSTSNLHFIGGKAFAETRLSSFYIPQYATFEGSILAMCYRMEKVEKHPNNNNYIINPTYYYVTDLTGEHLVYVPQSLTGSMMFNHKYIDNSAFNGSLLSKVTIKYAETIGDLAFANSLIEEVDFGSDSPLHYIGSEAFEYGYIKNIIIPKDVPSIEPMTFYQSSLETIEFEEGSICSELKFDTTTGCGVFQECNELVEVKLPDSLEIIGRLAFCSCPSLEAIKLPHNVYHMDQEAFKNCASLVTADLSECQLTSIAEGAFGSCISLENLSLPQGLKTIQKDAFGTCLSLKHVEFPDTLETIREGAFYACMELQTIDFGVNPVINLIDEEAFRMCLKLDFDMPSSVTTLGRFAFVNTHLTHLHVSQNLTDIGYGAFGANYYLTTVTTDENNPSYNAVDNVLYSKDHKKLIFVPASREQSYVILEGTETIEPYALMACVQLKNVTIPSSMIDIRFNAFELCISLEEIYIPQNVEYIGRETFICCYSLKQVTFEEGSKVDRLGFQTFALCGLEEATIPSNVSEMGQYVFAGNNDLTKVTFEENSQLTYIAAGMFASSNSLTEIIFENGSKLEELQAYAFANIYSLEKVDFGNAAVKKIGNYAFQHDRKLKEVNIYNATYIGRYAFYGCESMESFSIGPSIDFIGESAFQTITNLFYDDPVALVFFRNRDLPDYYDKGWNRGVAGYYFNAKEFVSTDDYDYTITYDDTVILTKYKKEGTDIVIDSINTAYGHLSIDEIGAALFQNRTDITSVTITSDIVSIGAYAFAGTSFKELTIPNTVETIGEYAFANSQCKLTFEEGSSLKSIGDYAFRFSRAFDEFNAPDSLTYIGVGAFSNSNYITAFMFGENSSLTTIEEAAFADSNIRSISLPSSISYIGDDAFYNANYLTTVTFAPSTTPLKISHYAFAKTAITNVDLPEGLYYLGDYVFQDCSSLENINVHEDNTNYSSEDGILYNYDGKRLLVYPGGKKDESFEISNAVTAINYASFYGQKYLKHVTFEEGTIVNTIGVEAFSRCEMLESIVIPASVISIDRGAFFYCPNLTSVIFEDGNQLVAVYEQAFAYCYSLEEIHLPKTVTEISYRAFYNDDKLTTIGIENDNNIIYLDSQAFAGSGLTSFHVSKDLVSIYYDSFARSDLKTITCDEDNLYYKVIDGVLFDKVAYGFEDYDCLVLWPDMREGFFLLGDGETVLTYEYTSSFGTYLMKIPRIQIADSVNVINKKALKPLSSLRFLSVGDLELFENDNNWGSGIDGLYLTGQIEEITGHFFGTSNSKFGVYINSFDQLNNIKFEKADSNPLYTLGTIILNGERLDTVHMTLENVSDYAFAGLKADKLYVEDSVKNIGENAFAYNRVTELIFSHDVTEVNETAFVGSKFEKITAYTNNIEMLFDSIYPTNQMNIITDLNTLVIYGYGEEAKIPDNLSRNFVNLHTLSLIDVKEIGINAFKYRPITTLNLGNAEKIGGSAFEGIKVSTLSLPNSLTYIGSYAFSNIDGIESLTIPQNVGEIGYNAFYNYKNLSVINYNAGSVIDLESPQTYSMFNTIGENVETLTVNISNNVTRIPAGFMSRLNNDDVELVINFNNASKLEEIGSYAFYGARYIKELKLPISLKTVNLNAFETPSRLTIDKFTIPSVEMYIKLDTKVNFSYYNHKIYVNDTLLTKLVVPNGITTIHSASFRYLDDLEEVYLPSSVASIESYAFASCPKLAVFEMEGDAEFANAIFDGTAYISKLKVPASFTQYMERATGNFGKYNLKEVEITTNTELASNAFSGAYKLEKFTFDKAIDVIPNYFLANCNALTEINFVSNKFTYIGKGAFSGVKDRDMTLDLSEVTYIGDGAFSGSYIKGKVVIPIDITYLGSSAFKGTIYLEEVEYNAIALDDYESCVFEDAGKDSGGLTVTFGSGVKNIPAMLFGASSHSANVSTIDASLAIDSLEHVGDYAFDRHTVRYATIPYILLSYVASSNTIEINLLDGEDLDFGYYPGFYELTKITLPATLKTINEYSFSQATKLKTVIAQEGITRIEKYAFYNCTALETFNLPSTVTYIGDRAFSNCTSLGDVTIPSSVTYLGSRSYEYYKGHITFNMSSTFNALEEGVFYEANITSINILEGVEIIKEFALVSKSLTDVYVYNNDVKYEAIVNMLYTTVHLYGYDLSTSQAFAQKHGCTFSLITKAMHDALHHEGTTHHHVDATCWNRGEDGTICNVCGFKDVQYTPKTSHHLHYYYRGMKVDCQHHPVLHDCYYCDICDTYLLSDAETPMDPDSLSSFIDLEHYGDHDYEWVVTKIATETEEGEKVGTCKICSHQETVVIPTSSHEHVIETIRLNEVVPTCTEGGHYDEITRCSKCGEIFSQQHVELGPKEHQLTEYNYLESTCLYDGNYSYYYCSECGKYFMYINFVFTEVDKSATVIPALEHSYGAWESVTSPTCTTNGLEERTCTLCGEAHEYHVIPALGHDLHYHQQIDPTCYEAGQLEYYECDRCGKMFSDNLGTHPITTLDELYIPPLQHEYGQWYIEYDATCTSEGLKYHSCVNCGHTTKEIIHTKPHTYDHDEYEIVEAATCTNGGVTLVYHVCGYCGQYYESNYEYPDPLGHDMKHIEREEPTCYSTGHIEHYHCDRCGKDFATENGENPLTYNDIKINQLEHDYVKHTYQEATCNMGGYGEYVCSHCGAYYGFETDPLGHDMVYHQAVEPTCEEEGHYEYWTCSHEVDIYYSDQYGYNPVPYEKLLRRPQHDFIYVSATSATCTTPGYKEHYYCRRCHAYYLWNEQLQDMVEVAYEDIISSTSSHNLHEVEAYYAGCKGVSNYAYAYCDICGGYFMKDEHGEYYPVTEDDIYYQFDGHDLLFHEAVEGDCHTEGMAAFYQCTSCGSYFLDEECTMEVNYDELSTGYHHHWTTEIINHIDASCDQGEAYDEMIICSECGEVGDITHHEDEAPGHQYGEWIIINEPTLDDPAFATHTCEVCGEEEHQYLEYTRYELFQYYINKYDSSLSLDDRKDALNYIIRIYKELNDEDKNNSTYENYYSCFISYINDYNNAVDEMNQKDERSHNDLATIIITSVSSISLLSVGLYLAKRRFLMF